jgi:2,5-diketo-D-gluconate reductase A
LSVAPHITLNDGNTIPQLGFGVFQIEPEDTAEAVREAIGVGYRHIDTAEMYGNEREVGEGIRASGIDRGEVYVTSKLNNGLHEPDDAREAFEVTLSDLGFNYVDLFLIHWPLPTLYDGDFVSTWRTLEEFHNDGRARSVGVSNFQVEHLERLAAETATVPSVNQIEVHSYFTNEAVREYGQDHGIATEAWLPIAGRGARRSHHHPDRREPRQDAGAGRVEVAHTARPHRVPEVGDAIAHEGELRALRLRDRAWRYGRDLCARPG